MESHYKLFEKINLIKIIIIVNSLMFSCVGPTMKLKVNENVQIQKLNSNINTENDDYSPCILPNGTDFIFVSDRDGSLINPETGNLSHDIWLALIMNLNDSLSKVTLDYFILSESPNNPGFNTDFNEGATCFSNDFKKMYFTGCNRQKSFGDCDLYEADVEIVNQQILISSIRNLGQNINTKKWESMPTISPDNKTMYFISNRDSRISNPQYIYNSNSQLNSQYNYYQAPNYDIYYSNFNDKTNKWMDAEKLTSKINTGKREYSPLLCPDNKTLIFASDGHKPNGGGFDLYYSKKDSNGNWSDPINFGTPMNSKYDDFFLTLTGNGEKGYFTSNRDNSKLDIYKFTMSSILDEIKIIAWRQDRIADVTIIIYDESGNQVNGIIRKAMPPGIHSFEWDGKDDNGVDLKNGKYEYQVFIGEDAPGFIRALVLKNKN